MAFCIACMYSAAVVVPDEAARRKAMDASAMEHISEAKAFAVPAAVACTECAEWSDAACASIWDNADWGHQFLAKQLPAVHSAAQSAGCSVRLDCSPATNDSRSFCDALRRKTSPVVLSGPQFSGNSRFFIGSHVASSHRIRTVKGRLERFRAFTAECCLYRIHCRMGDCRAQLCRRVDFAAARR